MATKKKALKKSKLRHAEYYDFQKIQDKLYAESMDGKMFTKLVEIITLPENIKLAYRNIKKNKGSKTAGTDGKTIQHLEKLSEEKLVVLVQRKFSWYVPQSVRRVEIPKDNVAVPESIVTEVLRYGTADIRKDILETIRQTAGSYVDEIFHILYDHEYSPELMKLHIIGGGGCLIRNFAEVDSSRVKILSDICATAKGYEYMAEMVLRKRDRA